LRYAYEEIAGYVAEGEHFTVPVIVYVYRRDRDLRWSEIKAYLQDGLIPDRYPPRQPDGPLGPINEPMNAENFRILARRFRLDTIVYSKVDWVTDVIRERSTNRVVQPHYMDFEEMFWSGPGITWDPTYFRTARPAEIHSLVLFRRRVWYLNGLQRSFDVGYRFRTGHNHVRSAYPPSDKV
jgi:hypothetical protein